MPKIPEVKFQFGLKDGMKAPRREISLRYERVNGSKVFLQDRSELAPA